MTNHPGKRGPKFKNRTTCYDCGDPLDTANKTYDRKCRNRRNVEAYQARRPVIERHWYRDFWKHIGATA